MEVSDRSKVDFLEELWGFYAQAARDELPWRKSEADGNFDPYKILVSELMLQQTQVGRVIPKYQAFLERFPNVTVLANAELGDVLREWQGLGYNRRAKFLWQTAQVLRDRGDFPKTIEELVKLPGIGANTAGAILAYTCNQPIVFVETNVRTVYIHHFFADQDGVHDKEIRSLVEQTVDNEHPREFYWALMDYGSYLKSTVGNLSKASQHYAKQSQFHGSRRQVRGAVLRALGGQSQTLGQLQRSIADERLQSVLDDLVREGLVQENHNTYRL